MAYIDRDKLLNELPNDLPYKASVKRVLIQAEEADVVEVRHGEWISKDCISKSKRGRTIHYSTYKCSVCGKWNGRHKQNHCSNCGADMRGKNETL